MGLPFGLSVAKLVKFKSFRLSVYRSSRLSVYRNASENEDPYYNEYLFAAQNQTRSTKGTNNTDNALYSVGMARNQRKCSLEVAETNSVVV